MREGPRDEPANATGMNEAPDDLTDCYNWPRQAGCEASAEAAQSAEEQLMARALTDCYNC